MPRAVYTPADHQKAFELWHESRNLSKVAELIGCEYTTIRDWRLDTYTCRWHCPWHGWERISNERQMALEARFKLVEAGNVDPVAHSNAMMAAVENKNGEQPDSYTRRLMAVDTIVRSDLEVISHFELLYGKLFQQITGLTIDHGGIHGLPEKGDRYKQLEILYNNGTLKAKGLEDAIKSMMAVRDFIKKLQEDLGIKKHTQHQDTATRVIVEDPEVAEANKELTIEELRKFRGMLEHTPPDKIEQVKQMMKADDSQVELVLGEQPTEPIPVSVLPPPPPPPLEMAACPTS